MRRGTCKLQAPLGLALGTLGLTGFAILVLVVGVGGGMAFYLLRFKPRPNVFKA